LQDEISRLKLENQGYRQREETFKRAMLNSQKVLEQMKKNAQKSAELIIADAEVKAEKLLNRAHSRLAQLHEDIAELKRQRIQIEIQVRSILENHTKFLDLGKEETEVLDEEDAKLKILKQPKESGE
jgi:cell division initiation protein